MSILLNSGIYQEKLNFLGSWINHPFEGGVEGAWKMMIY